MLCTCHTVNICTLYNVHPCVVELSNFDLVLQSHRQKWTDQPFRPRWECFQVPNSSSVHMAMYIRYNHQEWKHKLFLAGNWPWRAGFFITDPVLKPYGKLLTLWSSFLQNTVRKGVLQLPIHYVCPLSAGWKIISTNQNYWPDWIARVQNWPEITIFL